MTWKEAFRKSIDGFCDDKKFIADSVLVGGAILLLMFSVMVAIGVAMAIALALGVPMECL